MFRELYIRYALQLTNQAYRIVMDEEQAKDLVQEVFLQLYLKAETLPEDLNPGAYLNTSIRNRSLNILRDKRLQQQHHRHLAMEMREQEKKPLFETLELRMQLNSSMNALQGKSRDVFFLRHYENKSHREIAHIMGISPRTVEKHISKAVHQMREDLDENGINS